MQSFFILYSTLAVFGIGVTIIDLFGVFDQASQANNGDTGGDADGNNDAEADGDDAASEGEGAVEDGDRGSWVVSGRSGTRPGLRKNNRQGASRGTLAVAKAIGTLRTGVYFSLGAGPTGLFALLTGIGGTASLGWSAGAGVFIAILAKTLRAFLRRDLDSSIKPEEFLLDLAVISVPVTPGAMGKAIVSRYNRDTELYVRCKDQSQALAKGETVRIVDLDDDCYWVDTNG